jgi:hypothetical protein
MRIPDEVDDEEEDIPFNELIWLSLPLLILFLLLLLKRISRNWLSE